MQIGVLTLPYDATRGVFDDTELRSFTRDKVVLSVRDHFFRAGDVPHLALVIEYRLPPPSRPYGRTGRSPRSGSSSCAPRWSRETESGSISCEPGARSVRVTKECRRTRC